MLQKFDKASERNSPPPPKDAAKESPMPTVAASSKKSTKDDSISFIARTQEMIAQFKDCGISYNQHNMWDPPKARKDVSVSHTCFFRWTDGTVEKIDTPGGPGKLVLHNVSSVFVQKETGHLLVSDVDAKARDVSGSDSGEWKRLLFTHKRLSKRGRDYYTALEFAGDQRLTAAPMSGHCVPQLMPPVYNNVQSGKENAGIIGELSLLIALAVLSAKKENTAAVLKKSIAPREWLKHSGESGRGQLRSQFIKFYFD